MCFCTAPHPLYCAAAQDYLPKMSIPVEKRDLGDGWMITCRGEDGGDLTLSDVNIKRENLICQGKCSSSTDNSSWQSLTSV